LFRSKASTKATSTSVKLFASITQIYGVFNLLLWSFNQLALEFNKK